MIIPERSMVVGMDAEVLSVRLGRADRCGFDEQLVSDNEENPDSGLLVFGHFSVLHPWKNYIGYK